MKYYIIAGEHSGDIYGGMLAKAISKKDPDALFYGIGGDKMKEQEVELTVHIKELAIMGLWQIFAKITTLIHTYVLCIKTIKKIQPDVVVLIDYGGFNLKIAKWAKTNNFKVVYYILPKVWAWNEKRILKIKKYVDKALLIFPFEKEWYHKYEIPHAYVGNPQIEYLEQMPHRKINFKNTNLITLMPGSREQEVKRMLPIMLKAAKNFTRYQFVILQASNLPNKLYETIIAKTYAPNAHLVKNIEKSTLEKSIAAIVKSGTSTLQVALTNTPQIVCYKTSAFNYFIFKYLVRVTVKYISLPNLIMDREIVKELIQQDMTSETISQCLSELLNNLSQAFTKKILMDDYAVMKQKMQTKTKQTPSEIAAEEIIHIAQI